MKASFEYRAPRPVFFGFALVTLGILFLLREFGAVPDISVWTLIWLALGVWMFIGTLAGNRRGWFWPLALVLIGTFMLLRDTDVIDRDFAVWPIVVIAFGLAILFDNFTDTKERSEFWHSQT